MGIDAKILLRGVAPVSDKQLKSWSWDICASIGAEHFFTDAQKGYTAISRTLSRYREDGNPKPGAVYTQDGDDIVALPGECLLQVHVWSRFYGIGYERGDLLTLCAIAEWCEANIPGVEVWYGGDSSGVCVKPWPRGEREKLRHHLYSQEGRNYAYAACGPELRPHGLEPCVLCVPDRGMTQCGFGPSYQSWHCKGCGKTFETRDDCVTWKEREK